MSSINNPFGYIRHPTHLIQLLLHSTSLSDEILSEGSPAHRLVIANRFKEVNVISLPINNNEVLKKLLENDVVHTEYISDESSASLKASDGSLYNVVSPFAQRLPDKLWEPINSNSSVTLADIFSSNICDYLVVGSNDSARAIKVAGDNIITAKQALEQIRIVLTSHNLFYVTPNEQTSEWLYYLYRYKKLYKEIQYVWTIAVHAKVIKEKLYDYFDSLQRRLEFICRACDKVVIFSQQPATVDTQSNLLYHLAYFVMLITGVFDDLSHIIYEYYNMNPQIRSRYVGLRVQENKKFFKILYSENTNLHDFLVKEAIQGAIGIFYPIRDSLQHREFLNGTWFSESNENRRNIFEMSTETAESIKTFEGTSTFVINLHKPCLDPLPFTMWAQEILITIVNTVLSSIKWYSLYEQLPADAQEKIRSSSQHKEEGLAQSLGWSTEPLYF